MARARRRRRGWRSVAKTIVQTALIATLAFFGVAFFFGVYLPLTFVGCTLAAALIGIDKRGAKGAYTAGFLRAFAGFSVGSLVGFALVLAVDPNRYPTEGLTDLVETAASFPLFGLAVAAVTGFLAIIASRISARTLGASKKPIAESVALLEVDEESIEEQVEPSQPTRVVDAKAQLRLAGSMYEFGAVAWIAHCGIVSGVGVFVLLSVLGVDPGASIFLGFLVGVIACTVGALLLAVGTMILLRGTDEATPRQARAAGRAGAFFLFAYVALGAVAITMPFVVPVNFSSFQYTYILLDLWLVASLAFAVFTLRGGRFLAHVLQHEGIREDPLSLLFEFAALTATSVILLSGSLTFISGRLLVSLAIFPFAAAPALGVLGFVRLFRLGTRLATRRSS